MNEQIAQVDVDEGSFFSLSLRMAGKSFFWNLTQVDVDRSNDGELSCRSICEIPFGAYSLWQNFNIIEFLDCLLTTYISE
jgi:hypothetical protein